MDRSGEERRLAAVGGVLAVLVACVIVLRDIRRAAASGAAASRAAASRAADPPAPVESMLASLAPNAEPIAWTRPLRKLVAAVALLLLTLIAAGLLGFAIYLGIRALG